MEKLIAAIDREWVAERTRELVDIYSVTMAEAEVCRAYEAMMREVGLEVDVREVTPGRNNLYARIAGQGDGPALMLNGHLDTIPVGSCPPARREGNRVYGRGATDMKGGMAAALAAVKALLESGVKLQGDLWLTAIVGHEEVEAQKDGPLALIADRNSGRIGGDRILIVEGRDALWVMSMGSMVFTITLESDAGGKHTQYVPFAENPLRFVGALIERIHQYQLELDAGDAHALAGAERIDLGDRHRGRLFQSHAAVLHADGDSTLAAGAHCAAGIGGVGSLGATVGRGWGIGSAGRDGARARAF